MNHNYSATIQYESKLKEIIKLFGNVSIFMLIKVKLGTFLQSFFICNLI